MIFNYGGFGFIDFDDLEIAPIEWDIVGALAHWLKWDEKWSFDQIYELARDSYNSVSYSFEWNEMFIRRLLCVQLFVMMIKGLMKPITKIAYTQNRHQIESSLYYLSKI